MKLNGRALFNLLRVNWLEDKTVDVKDWQVEDLSKAETSELFIKLKHLGVVLDEQSFLLYAENAESPEELLELVWVKEEDLEGQDRTYLLLFELWKRLLPNRLSLSVLCDEIDQLIYAYDAGEMEDEEPLQTMLIILEDVLDDSSDTQGAPQEIFAELSSYCAHDLERFIFDYISDQIDAENTVYASELLDAFEEYIHDKKRFDFLRARLSIHADVQEGNLLLERLLDLLAEEPDLELLLTIAECLVRRGDVRLFILSIRIALTLIQKEEQFKEILGLMADYFRCLDREDEEKKIANLIDSRASIAPHQSISPSDIAQFSHLLKALPNSKE